ncbi:MAG: hypothetical protein ACLQMT_05085 [Candidatus Acidiferrales bacterium]
MTEYAMERNPLLSLITFLIGAGLLVIFGLAADGAAGAQLKPETVEAFDRYIQSRELQMNGTLASENNFSWLDTATGQKRAEAAEKLPRGEVVTEALEPADSISVPGGLIHDWIGIVFIPGVTLPQTLALLQDYDHAAKVYAPEVERSKLLSRSGNDFRVFLRLKRTGVVTVVFDTEYDIHYEVVGADRAYSHSYSTRVAEVENPHTPQEHEMPPGTGNGFLWRLYSYWRFEQRDGGMYVQCEAISLTRDIPVGLGWLVRPFIKSIPEKSLTSTLEETRKALQPGTGSQR